MKSRRALQVIVAVLAFVVLVSLLLATALIALAQHISMLPQEVLGWTNTFQNGLKRIAANYNMPFEALAAAVAGAPSLLLLLAVILILSKDRGKDAKNVVGCIFSLCGVLLLTVFLAVFAKQLFVQDWVTIIWYVCAGLLALFILFVGLALGVKGKKRNVVDDEPIEPFVLEEEEEREEKRGYLQPEVAQPTAEQQPSTPASPTQYTPSQNQTIEDVVKNTYGKEDDSLTSATIQKINKVRLLYESKAITEEEYLKLMRKYLGF